MSFDGIFLHYLLEEMRPNLLNQRINKVNVFDKTNYVFQLSNRASLLICSQPDSAHLRFSELEFVFDVKTSSLLNMLRKYLESAVIKNVRQIGSDRVAIIDCEGTDDLGSVREVRLIMEFLGRNANLILTDADYVVLECERKVFTMGEKVDRIMLPKVKYFFPKNDKTDPFLAEELANQNNYTGVSGELFAEMTFQNDLGLLHQPAKPVIFDDAGRLRFYCFDLTHLPGERTYFPTLSSMLETYFHSLKKQNQSNAEQKMIESHLKREIQKNLGKRQKQEAEYLAALENLKLGKIGNLLSSNLYLIKKGDPSVTVLDFYEQNQPLTIPLDPLMDPKRNLAALFAKYKKAKRTIIHLDEQIALTKADLGYLECLSDQLALAKAGELKEIISELGLGKQKALPKKALKPQITIFHFGGDTIMVGKNNVQNNYLTHALAKKSDWFFHVKDAPGSHTILRTKVLTDENIRLTGEIAAYFSKNRRSGQVPVDYTQVRNVKKVPGIKGSFVTYTHQKTVFVTPDYETIKQATGQKK